jgi:hypothetical protein
MELNDKFTNIDKLTQNDELKENYKTVKSLIEYEKKTNVYMINQNATLSLLRLNRGLEFLYKFLENIYNNQDNKKKSYELASKAYDDTLAFRHYWPVRRLGNIYNAKYMQLFHGIRNFFFLLIDTNLAKAI